MAAEVFNNQIGQHNPAIVISKTPTVSASPDYSAGDAVGGLQTLTVATRVAGGKVKLQSVTVLDAANQKAAMTLLFFESEPTAATITDNAAFAWSTDNTKCIGKINVAAADYETIDSKAVATVRGLNLIMQSNGTANLYVAVVTTGTPNLASTSDLVFLYGFDLLN